MKIRKQNEPFNLLGFLVNMLCSEHGDKPLKIIMGVIAFILLS